MRIGIDTHAAEKPGEGNSTYIRGFLSALLKLDTDNDYYLYGIDTANPFYSGLRAKNNVFIRSLGIKNPLLRIPIKLARQTYIDAVDLLHVQYIAPPLFKGKLVATIHDLCFLHLPATFSRIEGLRSRWLIRRTAKKADKIITGSEFSRRDIIEQYKLDQNKIALIPYGISHTVKHEKDPVKEQHILSKYGLEKPYILSLGRLNPRKNLSVLAQAFAAAKKNCDIPHNLVIAGKSDFRTKDMLSDINSDHMAGNIFFPGYVEEQDLGVIYQAADLFVYPSLFEGVGLPVLEAMQAGVPVIASNTTSLKEIVSDAGIAIPPDSVEHIADAICLLLKNSELSKDYQNKGLERAKQFTWEKTAAATLAIYEKLR